MSTNPSPTHSLQEARFRQKQIGKALGQIYAEVASEQPPESFLALLEQADQMQQKPLPQN